MTRQKPTSRKWPWIMALIAACLLAVSGWLFIRQRTNAAKIADLTLGKSADANKLKPNEQGGNSQGRDLCGGTGGIGQIISLGTNTFTIQRKNGSALLVTLTAQTTIKTPTGAASPSDLKVGDAVTLVGGPNSDGSFTADTVLVCGGIHPKTQ